MLWWTYTFELWLPNPAKTGKKFFEEVKERISYNYGNNIHCNNVWGVPKTLVLSRVMETLVYFHYVKKLIISITFYKFIFTILKFFALIRSNDTLGWQHGHLMLLRNSYWKVSDSFKRTNNNDENKGNLRSKNPSKCGICKETNKKDIYGDGI